MSPELQPRACRAGRRSRQPVEEVLWVRKRWISRRNEARDRRRVGDPPRIEQRSAGAKDPLSGANDFFNGLLQGGGGGSRRSARVVQL